LEKPTLPLIQLDLCTVTACKEERRKGTADGVAESEPFLANGILPQFASSARQLPFVAEP